MKLRAYSVVALLLISLACTQGSSADANARRAPLLSFVERVTGGANANESLPLIVAIHGLGDSPEAFMGLFDDLSIKTRVIAPRAPDPWGEGSSWYPIDDPQQKPRVIRERAQRVSDLISELTRLRATRGKPIVTGFSQGGVLSFAMAAYHSDQLRAALPIAGSLPDELSASLPPARSGAAFELVAFHGKIDQRIPFADGEKTVRAMKAQGLRASLQAFDGVGHQIPLAMRDALFATLQRLVTSVAPLAKPAAN